MWTRVSPCRAVVAVVLHRGPRVEHLAYTVAHKLLHHAEARLIGDAVDQRLTLVDFSAQPRRFCH